MRRLPAQSLVLPLALATCLLLAGCSALRSFGRVVFTGASFQDQEVHGVARGCVPVTGAIATAAGEGDPRLEALGPLLTLLGHDPLGCILQVERVGQIGEPFFVFCGAQGNMEATCRALPGNQPIVVTGQPIGPGGILVPSRIARDD